MKIIKIIIALHTQYHPTLKEHISYFAGEDVMGRNTWTKNINDAERFDNESEVKKFIRYNKQPKGRTLRPIYIDINEK